MIFQYTVEILIPTSSIILYTGAEPVPIVVREINKSRVSSNTDHSRSAINIIRIVAHILTVELRYYDLRDGVAANKRQSSSEIMPVVSTGVCCWI
jgi:hypothetical protein